MRLPGDSADLITITASRPVFYDKRTGFFVCQSLLRNTFPPYPSEFLKNPMSTREVTFGRVLKCWLFFKVELARQEVKDVRARDWCLPFLHWQALEMQIFYLYSDTNSRMELSGFASSFLRYLISENQNVTTPAADNRNVIAAQSKQSGVLEAS